MQTNQFVKALHRSGHHKPSQWDSSSMKLVTAVFCMIGIIIFAVVYGVYDTFSRYLLH
jgi:hypothetical protein